MIENVKPSLLIVEDEPQDVKALELILSPEGYDLVSMESGEKALEYLQNNKPDMVLLDIMFQGMDGFQVCQRLKEEKRTKEIPVVFISAKYDYKDVVKGFEMGAVDYITKPFNPLELVSRIKSHLALRATRLELERVNRSKDKLFSILSHDLRNPLINIQSGLRLLYDRTADRNVEWLKIYNHMVNISNSTFHLLNSTLDWSKSQMGEFKPQPRHFPLKPMLKESVNMFKGTAELNNLQLGCSADDINVFMDKEMLSVILRNLISNAVKFTPPGGKIQVDAVIDDSHLKVTIQDTGKGMDEEQLTSVLSFHKNKNMDSISDFGQGIGFAICHELTDKLGGTIQAKSAPGKGSTFVVILPVKI